MYNLTKGENAELNRRLMESAVTEMLHDEPDTIAALASCSAVIKAFLPEVNWAGFYLNKNGELVLGPSHGSREGNLELVLGPFQGLPACRRIPWGKGICGTAAAERRTVVAPDVHAFPGHIACDDRTNSELVSPLMHEGWVYGVLDIDSPILDRFVPEDVEVLTRIAGKIGIYLATKPGEDNIVTPTPAREDSHV